MINVASWNIRGLNFTPKQNEVRQVISENNLSVFAILESHVVKSKLMKMCSLVFRHWDWTSNGAWCSKGTRIILGWNHNEVDVTIINQNDQAVHSRLWLKKEKKEIFCTFVYAHNKYNQRRDLWNALCLHKVFVNNRPWCLLGDFNATLHLSESTASSSCIDIAMREFKDCVNNIEVLDVQNTGLQFTWNQKPKGTDGILKKLDRVMANMTFVNDFAGSHAIFKPYRNSDHSPSVLCIPTATKVKPKPFKFFNVLIKHDRFKEVVNEAWNYHVSGFYMFRTVKKLKNLKKPLRKLMIDKGNLHANVERIRGELDTIQTQLDIDPFNIRLREIEAANVVAFNQAVLDEEMFLKQKAKISWLKDGDSNTAYFHKSVKSRVSRSRIDVISNSDGIIFANDKVSDAFVAHYEAFLGQTGKKGSSSGYCDKLELINLCFADDLFIFAYGDVQSVVVIKECLDEFKHASGLIPSIPKSTAFFCNVLNHVKLSILNVLPFEEGRLPVKYLGVPLVSSRLKARDCKELVEKVQNRVLDWKNKALSRAVRPLIIRSVISLLQCFGLRSSKGKAKVAWELVCLPKDEGGLGIRRLEHFNSALLVSHIWNLLSLKESLWVKWVHAYKLNGRNFWDVPIRGNMSWSWRKILQLRPSIREFIWRKIGNGSSTSIWFDKWCLEGPLASRVSPRDIHRAGLTLYSHVGDVIRDGDWVWPRVLLDKYQFLNECTVPLSNNCDTLEWRLYDGTVKRFSVAQVWECIRPRADKVPWVDLIWFAMGIPRHAFNLWLIINHKLKTQDRVSIWDYSNVLGSTCPLCEATPDSHEHLFFICPFANSVWSRMKVKAGLGRVSHNIYDIVDHFGGIARRKTTHVVIAKLVVAASAYFIWQERNWRLFKKSKRSIDQVVACISSSVRMKLLSCAFKRTTEGVLYARLWDLPNSIFR
ncbi:RNA-directed DNA polymerase, eukaryota, reverse transcriptase zinc-binding domain protein [Tanacetum coccineum]